jgi:hypothetical protein
MAQRNGIRVLWFARQLPKANAESATVLLRSKMMSAHQYVQKPNAKNKKKRSLKYSRCWQGLDRFRLNKQGNPSAHHVVMLDCLPTRFCMRKNR